MKNYSFDPLAITLEDGRVIRGHYYGGRLSQAETPEGYNRYDLREDDDNCGDIAEVKDFVLVNHFGTFVTKETIDCTEGIPVTYWDWDYYTWENYDIDNERI